MARYDRIARLDPPARESAFPGWLAVRDLQRDERDRDLGRRARLRFLTARLVYRMAEFPDGHDSLDLQADAAREELGQLPARDPERELLTGLIKTTTGGDATVTARAAVELADALLADGDAFASEEFYRAAGAVADQPAGSLGDRIRAGIEKAAAARP